MQVSSYADLVALATRLDRRLTQCSDFQKELCDEADYYRCMRAQMAAAARILAGISEPVTRPNELEARDKVRTSPLSTLLPLTAQMKAAGWLMQFLCQPQD